MRKIMTLFLVALLAFSLLITFAACGDNEDDNKVKNNETSETTESNTSETTTGETQTNNNLNPSEEDEDGKNFNPMRPL